jgi:hypothetical protein
MIGVLAIVVMSAVFGLVLKLQSNSDEKKRKKKW